MPWESIGECDGSTASDSQEWIDFCHETAIAYLRVMLGDPPPGCSLEVKWNDHDLGAYPTIGLWWEAPADDAPWDYINRAETLLDQFNEAVDWSSLKVAKETEDEDDET